MRVLLDTHVWLWSLLDPDQLAPAIRELIESGDHELLLSAITPWEVLLLHERGRLDLGAEPARWLDFALAEYAVTEVPIDRAIAVASRRVELPHRDPADRFLAATALLHGLVLATHDEALLRAPAIDTLGP